MPINSVQVYIQNLIDGLLMPGSAGALRAYITPPDPNVEAEIPTAYVWPSNGDESRNPAKGGTVPRNTGIGTASGYKSFEHHMDIWVVWFGQDDDPQADTWFPGMLDAIMLVLRTSPDPAVATDPYTEQKTTLIDVGEVMTYHITIRALEDQRYNRYDGLITLEIAEIMQFLSSVSWLSRFIWLQWDSGCHSVNGWSQRNFGCHSTPWLITSAMAVRYPPAVFSETVAVKSSLAGCFTVQPYH